METHKKNADYARVPDDLALKVFSGKSYAHDDIIYPAFKWLRENVPVGKGFVDGYDPIWIITKHEDIEKISVDADIFKNSLHNVLLQTQESDEFIRKMQNGKIRSLNSLAFMDKPEHDVYRRITSAWFLPVKVKRFEERIRKIARESVEEFVAFGGECDFVKDFALYYPLRVIMDLLGVPRSDEKFLLKLTQELFAGEDPDEQRADFGQGPDALAKAWHSTMVDFYDYFRELSRDRRENPKDDLISLIANHKIDGQHMDEVHEFDYYIAIATAGHDTTSTASSGGMLGLIRYPEQFEKLQADLGLTAQFVDEAVRWTTPIKHFMRTAAQDVELRGQQIKKNDRLMLCYPSANRDEDVFENPDTFIIDRPKRQHLAFGKGAHMCLGQNLAKLEMKILFEELLPRIESIELAGEIKFLEAVFTSGLKTMPVRYRLK